MLFDADVTYDSIQRTAAQAAGPLLESVNLLSIYTGEQVEPGKKSVALRFTLRAVERTLMDTDADATLAAVESALCDDLGAAAR
jgi:phenylalanyl-tRNA synthetase beta chain